MDLIWDWRYVELGEVRGTSISTRLNWPANSSLGFRGTPWNGEHGASERLLTLTHDVLGNFMFQGQIDNTDLHWALCYSGEDLH